MIKEIKWNDNAVLDDLILNFEKPNGGIYDTIIIAGENGSGKTKILSTISTFLNLGSIRPFDHIRYEIEGNNYLIYPNTQQESYLENGFHIRLNESTEQSEEIYSNRNNNFELIAEDKQDIRHYGCVYSKARSGFNTEKVQSATTQQLDSDRYDDDLYDNFTSIKQLIVDIDSQDSSEWMNISRAGLSETFDSFQKRAKLTRFREAFNRFFDNIEFDKVDLEDLTEKRILFKKFNRNVPIDDLSTGEKQIVFRGAQLLRNSRNLSNGTILIDEPELSMHPKWQEKVLDFYRGLFTVGNKQTAQIFIATHSEYVLKSALKDRENVLVIVLKNVEGKIRGSKIMAPTILPSITDAEVNYNAFGVASTDYHIQLYGYLQNKVGLSTVQSCDNFIQSSSQYNASIHFKPSMHPNGHTSYQTLPTYIRNAIDHPDSRNTFTDQELETSINLLISLCK